LPYTGNETAIFQTLSIKPIDRLQIDNTYILERVVNGLAKHAVVNSDIIRTKWNYQFTREFSLRFIGQYNGLLANPAYSSLQTDKNLNFDVLFTYLLHPGTAVYVGYNSNLENIDPELCMRLPGSGQCDPNGPGLLHTTDRLTNDGRQLFVKISYLFRR
jgi:predicted porin